MGNLSTLSTHLVNKGWIPVLGTSEKREDCLVGIGVANSYGFNNGVAAIYDERGIPWISLDKNKSDAYRLIEQYDLKSGAYVPHSNDQLSFLNQLENLIQTGCNSCGNMTFPTQFCTACGNKKFLT